MQLHSSLLNLDNVDHLKYNFCKAYVGLLWLSLSHTQDLAADKAMVWIPTVSPNKETWSRSSVVAIFCHD